MQPGKGLGTLSSPVWWLVPLTKFLELSGAKAPIVDNTACRVVVEFFVILHCASRCKI